MEANEKRAKEVLKIVEECFKKHITSEAYEKGYYQTGSMILGDDKF